MGKELILELDRIRAIEKAIIQAKQEDIILIAEKGHETYQILGNTTIPFDDQKAANSGNPEAVNQ
ncbi:hypothetical protein [Heyndrickxia acidicola]|uniref:UDP-N-acetylmuramoylalanyl-D-glutamate--2, 6-diaminopimelate ligase n=1 Tax=Heyndrickxia acidicola TaxID=209389 RepID=A0ABU6MAP6_9BACI|nr:hypothetical protein [Heyndrickxia acidicola]MED1201745.1 UDP-N-acetylmuramoylalanyl-D-glutamate--2,6-diaminopimelate ligase [Heyndrickxia acidicola]